MGILILLVGAIAVLTLTYFSNELSNRVPENIPLEDIKLAMDEIKDLSKMKFEIVPAKIMYPKAFWFMFKGLAVLLCYILIATILDSSGLKGFHFVKPETYFIVVSVYLFLLLIVYIGPYTSIAWDYYYYKYGLSKNLKHADIIDVYIINYLKKFMEYHFIAVVVGYIAFKLLFGFGTLGVAVFSFLTIVGINIFISIEEKRIGFAPIFNLFAQKLNEITGIKNGR